LCIATSSRIDDVLRVELDDALRNKLVVAPAVMNACIGMFNAALQ